MLELLACEAQIDDLGGLALGCLAGSLLQLS